MGLNLKSYKMGKCSFNGAIFDKEGNEIVDKAFVYLGKNILKIY